MGSLKDKDSGHGGIRHGGCDTRMDFARMKVVRILNKGRLCRSAHGYK